MHLKTITVGVPRKTCIRAKPMPHHEEIDWNLQTIMRVKNFSEVSNPHRRLETLAVEMLVCGSKRVALAGIRAPGPWLHL